jgi:CMP-N,N'-diacetyllegionaminic acid synthase
MISGEKVLGLIPARGGSKGIRRKNVREVAGKPLIAWTIEAARASRYIDRLVLSSDDAEIIGVARDWGCEAPFVRPAELARDETPGIEPVLDALARLPGYALVVLLQPTSPLRSPEDIDGCIELCAARGANACVSVSPASESPYWMFTLEDAKLRPLLASSAVPERRQDLPAVHVLNGAVYVARIPWLLGSKTFIADGTLAHVMPAARSVDVDEERDLRLVELILSETRHG